MLPSAPPKADGFTTTMLPLELTEKNLNRNIARLAIPAAAENVLHMMVFIVDIIMVGRLGTEAIASVGLAGALNFVLTIVFSSLSAGTLSLVARHTGARERSMAERGAAQSLLRWYLPPHGGRA